MNHNLRIRIIVENPLPNIDYGLQRNKTFKYNVIQKQPSDGSRLQFDFTIHTKKMVYLIDYGGSLVHGEKLHRYFYLKLGPSSGEVDSIWRKRIKIPLEGLDEELVKSAIGDAAKVFQTRINGSANNYVDANAEDNEYNKWHLNV